MSTTGPRPKRLHFPTPLTEREDGQIPAQAMTPSQAAGSKPSRTPAAQTGTTAQLQQERSSHSQETEEEESPEHDAEMHVDYF